MLRRKLLFLLGPIVALLLLVAVAAVWMLQGVLKDLEHIDTKAWTAEKHVNELSAGIGLIEVNLYELRLGRQRHLNALIDRVDTIRDLVGRMGDSYVMRDREAGSHYQKIKAAWPRFERHVGALAVVQDPEISKTHSDAALNLALELRKEILPLGKAVHDHTHQEQESLVAWMRWLVLGLSIVFLMVINLAVLMLMRAGGMILSPVEKLVKATRELAADNFGYRVELNQKDEFGELAAAYNSLASQLQAKEAQRLETLGHVATALNHELNNAMGVISLQLQLLSRRTTEDSTVEKCLRRIKDGLERMATTVEALKHIKRIVLTDYIAGTKMLDLKRSTEEPENVDEEPVRA